MRFIPANLISLHGSEPLLRSWRMPLSGQGQIVYICSWPQYLCWSTLQPSVKIRYFYRHSIYNDVLDHTGSNDEELTESSPRQGLLLPPVSHSTGDSISIATLAPRLESIQGGVRYIVFDEMDVPAVAIAQALQNSLASFLATCLSMGCGL